VFFGLVYKKKKKKKEERVNFIVTPVVHNCSISTLIF